MQLALKKKFFCFFFGEEKRVWVLHSKTTRASPRAQPGVHIDVMVLHHFKKIQLPPTTPTLIGRA
jgi:hypothetical protein